MVQGHPSLTSHADDAHDDYKKTQNDDNKAELSHEVLAGGASFMAMKEWEDHQRKEGTHPSPSTQHLPPLTD